MRQAARGLVDVTGDRLDPRVIARLVGWMNARLDELDYSFRNHLTDKAVDDPAAVGLRLTDEASPERRLVVDIGGVVLGDMSVDDLGCMAIADDLLYVADIVGAGDQ